MRSPISALIVGLAALGAPLTAHADCALFSPDGTACVTVKRKAQADLAQLAAATAPAQKLLADAQRAAMALVPTDCKMVKPVDPRFVSRMPVRTPDPSLKLPIRTVPVPSCGKPESDERR